MAYQLLNQIETADERRLTPMQLRDSRRLKHKNASAFIGVYRRLQGIQRV
jgi:hypothetical protein